MSDVNVESTTTTIHITWTEPDDSEVEKYIVSLLLEDEEQNSVEHSRCQIMLLYIKCSLAYVLYMYILLGFLYCICFAHTHCM